MSCKGRAGAGAPCTAKSVLWHELHTVLLAWYPAAVVPGGTRRGINCKALKRTSPGVSARRYVPYACHVLRAALPDKGFKAHVIGYTLHVVLEAVVKVGPH